MSIYYSKYNNHDVIYSYVLCFSDSFDLLFGVIIFRLRAGFDATDEASTDTAKGQLTI